MSLKRSRFRMPAPVAIALALVAGGAFAAPDPGLRGPDAVPPSESLAKARETVGKMEDTKKSVDKLRDEALKRKDVIKVTCLDDKGKQLTGYIAVANTSLGTLKEAITRNDDGLRGTEAQRINILYQKVLVARVEAQKCVGDDLTYVGDTQVDLYVDSSIPQRDFTAIDLPGLDTTRPPVASAF